MFLIFGHSHPQSKNQLSLQNVQRGLPYPNVLDHKNYVQRHYKQNFSLHFLFVFHQCLIKIYKVFCCTTSVWPMSIHSIVITWTFYVFNMFLFSTYAFLFFLFLILLFLVKCILVIKGSISASATSMTLTMTTSSSIIINYSCIHFKEWSKTNWKSFMIFH